ncbi:MAG: hypothetical protein VXY23_15875 [Pseudomonadota bacterium]|mgnify:FL=1|jgi:hypothetical protein|nr:hypothetical protein [Pseudomonadota bacterium]
MADQIITHPYNPFIGEDNEDTLVKTFTVVGLLREFMELKTEINYDEREAAALILRGVESALIDQNNANTAPESAVEKELPEAVQLVDQVMALYKISSPEKRVVFWEALQEVCAPEYVKKAAKQGQEAAS